MRLFFVRHGAATPRLDGRDHPDRALTDKGRAQLSALAARLQSAAASVDLILSSPWRRARESAELFGSAAVPGRAIELWPELEPEAVVLAAASPLAERRVQCALIFGHEPLLSDWAARLLGSPAAAIVLKKGACLEIECDDPAQQGGARLLALLPPRHLR